MGLKSFHVGKFWWLTRFPDWCCLLRCQRHRLSSNVGPERLSPELKLGCPKYKYSCSTTKRWHQMQMAPSQGDVEIELSLASLSVGSFPALGLPLGSYETVAWEYGWGVNWLVKSSKFASLQRAQSVQKGRGKWGKSAHASGYWLCQGWRYMNVSHAPETRLHTCQGTELCRLWVWSLKIAICLLALAHKLQCMSVKRAEWLFFITFNEHSIA